MSGENGLPKGWTEVCLRDVVNIEYGKNLPTSQFQSSGYPVFGANGQIGFFDRYTREEPEVLITCRGATCGTINVSLPRSFVTNNSMILSPLDPTVLDKTFLKYALLAVDRSSAITGSAQPQITINNLAPLRIRLAPFDDQLNIVTKIEQLFSDLDAGVAALERARANLKRYRAAVLKSAVEGRLTASWRAANPDVEPASELLKRILADRRQKWEQDQLAKYEVAGSKPPKNWKEKYKEPAPPASDDLPGLPKGWCWASVSQCAAHEDFAITDGPFGSNLKTEHYTARGPRVIRLQNIGDGTYVHDDAHIATAHFNRLVRHSVRAGDVVVAMLGEVLPRACIVPSSIYPAIVKADCVKITPEPRLVHSEYIAISLNSHPTRSRASSQIAGVGRPRLNLEKLRPLAISLPPISEQDQIVARVAETTACMSETVKGIQAELIRSTRLRQSILKRAFEGKVV